MDLKLDRRVDRHVLQPYLLAPGASDLAQGEGPGMDDGAEAYLSLARAMLGASDPAEVYAVRVQGDSLLDASIHDGDIVVMRRQATAEEGDLVAVRVEPDAGWVVRRYSPRGRRVQLLPVNPEYPAKTYPAEALEIHAKVVLVIRQLDPGTGWGSAPSP